MLPPRLFLFTSSWQWWSSNFQGLAQHLFWKVLLKEICPPAQLAAPRAPPPTTDTSDFSTHLCARGEQDLCPPSSYPQSPAQDKDPVTDK